MDDTNRIFSKFSKKSKIIKNLKELILDLDKERSHKDIIIWIKRFTYFIENEFPRKQRYHNYVSLLNEFIKDDNNLTCSPSIVKKNITSILSDLINAYDIDSDISELFTLELHPKVIQASGALLKNGHYAEAIFETVKVLNNFVKDKAGIIDKDLSNAMAQAFNEKNPLIKLNTLQNQSDKDEQEGFKFLFMGAMKGIRNPMGHETYEITEINIALEYLAFLSLLFRKAEEGNL